MAHVTVFFPNATSQNYPSATDVKIQGGVLEFCTKDDLGRVRKIVTNVSFTVVEEIGS